MPEDIALRDNRYKYLKPNVKIMLLLLKPNLVLLLPQRDNRRQRIKFYKIPVTQSIFLSGRICNPKIHLQQTTKNSYISNIVNYKSIATQRPLTGQQYNGLY
jgi:hypothetical protein